MEWVWIVLWALGIGLGVLAAYWIIRGAVGAAIRDNAWAIRGEAKPPRIDPVTGRPEGD